MTLFLWIFGKILATPNSLLLKAFHSWNKTNEVNTMVDCWASVPPSACVFMSISKAVTINNPLVTILSNMSLVTIEAFLLMGWFSSKCSLGGSSPKVKAGGPSMIIFTHNNCNVVKGILYPISSANITVTNATTLTVSWN